MALTESSRLLYWDARYDPLRAVGGPDATFERSTGAYEFDGALWRPRILNQPRVEPARDIDGRPTSHVRLEPAVDARATDPAGPFTAGGAWTHAAGIADSDPAASMIQGEAARILQAGAANQYIFQSVGSFAGTRETWTEIFEVLVVPGNTAKYCGVWDLDPSVGTWVYRYSIDLSDLTVEFPGVSTVDGTGWGTCRKLLDVGPNGGPVYIAHGTYQPTIGHARRLYWYPWSSSGAADGGRTVLHYYNVNDRGYPHEVDLSDVGSLQGKDLLHFPVTWDRQPYAGCFEFTYLASIDGSPAISTYHLSIAKEADTSTDPRMLLIRESHNNWWRTFDDSGPIARNENHPVAVKPGDRVRYFFRARAADLAGYVETSAGVFDSGTDVDAVDMTTPWPAPAKITLGAAASDGSLGAPIGAQRLLIVKEGDLDNTGLGDGARDELAGYYLDPHGRLIS